jgi:cytoskeleton-associated protein 5
VSAYEELAKLFRTLPSSDDPEYRKWLSVLKKLVTDANAAAQDAGIAAVVVFLQNADIGGQYARPARHFS